MFPKRQSLRWHTGREGESRERLYGCGDGGFWPNVATSQIADKLEEIGDIMAASDKMPIVEGDLKAKSPVWGSKSADRSKLVFEWCEQDGKKQ